MTIRLRSWCLFSLCAAAGLAGPAQAMQIVPGTLMIERNVTGDPAASATSWMPIACASGTTTVYKGDLLRLSMTLRNDNGVLGSLFGAFSTVYHECGANPGYICPPSPGNPADVPLAVSAGDLITQEDWPFGLWGGEMWIWPRLGPPPCVVSPTGPCPNETFPTRATSPVSIVSAMSVTVFDFNGEYYGIVEEFDPAGPSWRLMTPMPTARSRFGMGEDANGNLIAIGGRSDLGILDAVESFDPGTGPIGTWTSLAPVPTARADLAAANWSGTIFAIGGRNAAGVTGVVEVFDPAQNVWWATGSLNTPRYGASAVVSPMDGKLYVIGGFDASGFALSEIEQYDDATGTWIPGYAYLNFARGFAGASVDPGTGYIVIAGGYDGTTMRPETEMFDAVGMFASIMGNPVPGPFGVCGPEPRGRFGFAGDGTGMLFMFGGMWGGCFGSNTLHYASLPDPAFAGAGGDDYQYDPASDTWTPLASSMTVARWDLAAGSRGGKLYAVGGYSGPRWAATATPDTASISWVFRAEANWAALDFSLFGMGQDDGVDMTSFASMPFSGVTDEGTYFNCADGPSCSGGTTTGTDGTNGTIFTSECGGTITIRSPLEISPSVRPLSGSRPPQTVYIGDAFELRIAATNYGGAFTIGGPDACALEFLEPGSAICLFPLGLQGGCSVGSIAPTTPAIPFAYPALGIEDVLWTYSVAGAGGTDPCSIAGVGSGTIYLSANLYGADAYATVYVVPPPLSISATVSVDPDGVSGGAFGWIPLGVTAAGRPGPYYYQGGEDLKVSFIYTNTSPTYSFDIAPVLSAGTYDAALLKSAPVVTGSLLLAPGASSTVSWVVSRDPAGSLQNCLGHDISEPDIIGVIGFNTVIRGLQGSVNVEMRDHPFHPTPFDPADDCAGGCPAGTRNLTFQVPATQPVGGVFNATLVVHNTADRPFVLDASATLWMENINFSGSVVNTASPTGGAVTWLAGETLNFTWTYTALASGRVCFNAGIDFWSPVPPCHRACRTGAAYCAPRSPPLDLITPNYDGCELLILVPGILQVMSYTASPALACDEATQVTTVAITVRNTSSVYCGVIDQICNGAPYGYAAGFPLSGGYANITSGPFPVLPVLPWTISVGGQITVTFYADAICPAPSGGWLEFGCTPSVPGLVNGKAVDCAFGTVVNPADVPAWSPTAPIRITQPASLWCSAWTDNDRYSVGQTITVSVTLENQGGDDLTGFGAAVYARGALGGTVAPLAGPVPPVPWTYTGTGACGAPPPYPSSQTFVWTFQALSRGKITFTATSQGWDAGCGNWKSSNCLMPEIIIADEAKLSVSAYASGLVTMSVSCTGCPPQSGCDPASGVGCVDVTLKASNFGGVDLACFEVPDGDPAGVFQPCPGCATAFTAAALACLPAGPARCGDCVPCAAQGCDGAPGCQAAAPAAPPACSATAMWNPGQYPGCPGTVLQAGDTRAYRWRYAPAGLGCFRANVWARGNDDATCDPLFAADGLPPNVLEGSGTTNCVRIKARYPLEISLVAAPAQIAPGQEFIVQVRICNPGETAGGLQGGEPALQFYEAGTGAKITEQYDVVPPPPVVLAAGACQLIDVRVTAHKNAAAGGVEIRVPQGAVFIATDADTGLPFPARDTGAPLVVTVINPANRFVVMGDNQTRILRQPVMFSYQVADAGTGGGRTTLKIYTLGGELVRTLIDKPAAVEDVTVAWDGRNESGQMVAAGVYLARLTAPSMKDGKVVKVPILK